MSNIDLNISEIVRCKDCRHRPILTTDSEHSRPPKIDGVYEDWTCPYLCEDYYYSRMPTDDGFCHKGEMR